jgi:hypothetical protein
MTVWLNQVMEDNKKRVTRLQEIEKVGYGKKMRLKIFYSLIHIKWK